jgi:hypothetical protein
VAWRRDGKNGSRIATSGNTGQVKANRMGQGNKGYTGQDGQHSISGVFDIGSEHGTSIKHTQHIERMNLRTRN